MWKYGAVVFLVAISFKLLLDHEFPRKPPKFEKDDYFGEGAVHADDETIHDFSISIDPSQLEDLKERVRMGRQRLQAPLEGSNFEFGFNTAYLKNLTETWLKYDWKQHEYFLNTFQHYRTELEGLLLHFTRTSFSPKKNEKKLPIILIHGYPSSFWDFYKVIPILANPGRFGFDFGGKGQIVFDVVVPSIPGFAWSEGPSKQGFGFIECARVYSKLMERLGHKKYFVFGMGDLGVEIATALAHISPDSVWGLQVANPYISPLQDAQVFAESVLTFLAPNLYLDEREQEVILPLDRQISSFLDHFGFFMIQKTRPDSLSVAVNDSPLGLASWLLDRFALGIHRNYTSHPQGWLQNSLTVDELLTEVHIYWLTGTLPHAARFFRNSYEHPLYRETMRASLNISTAVLVLPSTSYTSPRHTLSRRYTNLVRYTIGGKGGDFPALQESRFVAQEIFSFVEELTS
uniref:Epoxide hydrolase n=1 Tax=Steinernema glaseri TaxID=37863 RepID=A0A1I7Z6F4_9BILA